MSELIIQKHNEQEPNLSHEFGVDAMQERRDLGHSEVAGKVLDGVDVMIHLDLGIEGGGRWSDLDNRPRFIADTLSSTLRV